MSVRETIDMQFGPPVVEFLKVPGGLRVTDPYMGRRVIPDHDAIALVTDQHKYLTLMRADYERRRLPITENLKKDIATYQYILSSPNVKDAAYEYFMMKSSMGSEGGSEKILNYQVAEELGWKLNIQ